MKVIKDFSLQEFVPPMIFEQYVDKAIWFVDPKLFSMAQFIRDRFGKAMTINNYMSGGTYQYSAFRDHLCTIGAVNSQHRHGRAFNFRIKGATPAEVRQDIIDHYHWYREVGLTTIEAETPTWVHVDCRNTNQETLLIVPYK